MEESNGREAVSKTAILPVWLSLLLAASVGILAGFYLLDTTAKPPVWAEIRAICIAIGWAGVAACLPEVVNVLLKNIWPRPEFRHVCADVLNEFRAQQIETALRAAVPANALRAVYKGDAHLEEFDSSVIYHSIGEMHEGAFLAAVDLWDPENYNEDLLVTNETMWTSVLQRAIFQYRNRVAAQIKNRHIIAARRYRVKTSSNWAFLTKGNTAERNCVRLKSLALLAENVAFDVANGWIVDIEYCDNEDRHYPNLDYALLFGAQPPNGMTTARVAYVTESRAILKERENYVGVQVNDPLIITRLMKDRFYASYEIERSEEFLANAVSLITSQYGSLSASSSECSEVARTALVHVKEFLSNALATTQTVTNTAVPLEAGDVSKAPNVVA
jgi:hypothetical protein